MERLHPDPRRLKAVLLLGFTKGMGKAFCKPTAQLADQRRVVHGIGGEPMAMMLQDGPIGPMVGGNLRKTSTTPATLHGFALGLLEMVFMVTKALQLCKDSRLRHLALEPAQGGFNAFVFANSDLSHAETGVQTKQA